MEYEKETTSPATLVVLHSLWCSSLKKYTLHSAKCERNSIENLPYPDSQVVTMLPILLKDGSVESPSVVASS